MTIIRIVKRGNGKKQSWLPLNSQLMLEAHKSHILFGNFTINSICYEALMICLNFSSQISTSLSSERGRSG